MKRTDTTDTDLPTPAGDASLGRVAGGVKRFITPSRRDTPDSQRRSLPLDWVKAVVGTTVHLSPAARKAWLTMAEFTGRKGGL